jgi:hypothetical protein
MEEALTAVIAAGGIALLTLMVTLLDAEFPAASVAAALKTCEPSAAVVVFQKNE